MDDSDCETWGHQLPPMLYSVNNDVILVQTLKRIMSAVQGDKRPNTSSPCRKSSNLLPYPRLLLNVLTTPVKTLSTGGLGVALPFDTEEEMGDFVFVTKYSSRLYGPHDRRNPAVISVRVPSVREPIPTHLHQAKKRR